MPKNNEKKYIEALNGLESKEETNELNEIKVDTASLDQIQEVMSKMEWSLQMAVNSCLTYALSVSKSIDMSGIGEYSLMDDFESIELDLSVKNQNRLNLLAESYDLDADERILSYVFKESVMSFYCLIIQKSIEDEQR